MSTLNQPNESAPVLSARVFWILFTLIALVGTSIRVTDSAAWRRTGPDELMYRRYVNMMDGYEGTVGVFPSDARTARTGSGGLVAYTAKIQNTGAMAMPEMADFYIETQKIPMCCANCHLRDSYTFTPCGCGSVCSLATRRRSHPRWLGSRGLGTLIPKMPITRTPRSPHSIGLQHFFQSSS
jgi:hypothetical protein